MEFVIIFLLLYIIIRIEYILNIKEKDDHIIESKTIIQKCPGVQILEYKDMQLFYYSKYIKRSTNIQFLKDVMTHDKNYRVRSVAKTRLNELENKQHKDIVVHYV